MFDYIVTFSWEKIDSIDASNNKKLQKFNAQERWMIIFPDLICANCYAIKSFKLYKMPKYYHMVHVCLVNLDSSNVLFSP